MKSAVLVALLLASSCAGLPAGKPWKGHSTDWSEEFGDTTRWFEDQKQDHFDAISSATFRQRYFVNASFFDGTGPVFLCVGGEGPPLAPTVVITGGEHCAWMIHLAEKHRALILALEHRYYGPSVPVADFSTPNMRFLSSEQALADMAYFHGFVVSEHKLTQANKWVTFGGSYPGMMASFARLKYPNLFHASVSSSAPVQAKVNMQGYNDVCASSIASELVGGSADCLAQTELMFEALGNGLKTAESRRALEKTLNVCQPGALESVENQGVLINNMNYLYPIQGNDPDCTTPGCNIREICKVARNVSSSPLERLAELSRITFGSSCVDVDYKEEIASLTNTTLQGGVGRIWFWQTCTEFAFYQTCDPGTRCPFTKSPHLNNLQSYFDQCEAAFGIKPKTIEEHVDYSNAFYGGDHPKGTRILYVNGDIDPWHALSVLPPSPSAADLPAIMVPGASHHSWTHPLRPTDTQALREARAAIAYQVAEWLAVE